MTNRLANNLANGLANDLAGGSVPNPLQIFGSDLVMWFRADLGITIGTGVSQWSDQSANGNHVTQATGGNQPAYFASGGPNNLPYVSFDGTNDILTKSSPTGAANGDFLSLISMCKWPGLGATANPRVTCRWGAGAVNVTSAIAAAGTSFLGTANTTTVTGGTSDTNWAALESIQYTGAGDSMILARGGVGLGSGAVTAIGGTPGVFNMGQHGGTGQYSDVKIAELFVVKTKVTPTRQAAYQAYLVNRYGSL